jgi:hypothetical protein
MPAFSDATFFQSIPGTSYEEDEIFLPVSSEIITYGDSPFGDYSRFTDRQIEKELFLGALTDPTFKIIEPFKINISQEGDKIIANSEELEVHGFGDDLNEAIMDLQLTIQELYETLTEDSENLGPYMVEILAILNRKISKT